MLQLEQRLQQRFPTWFRGRRAGIARPLLRTLGRWSRFDTIDGFLARSGHLRDFAFVDAALEHLQARYTVETGGRIPERGRLLIVANHPSGAVDALALLHHIGSVRRDVRIVANDLLSMLQPLAGLLLPVRILGGRASADSLRAIEQALAQEQCVIVFPAGEVSRLGLRGVRDGRWQRGFVRFARKSGAPVLPVRIQARNSALFYGASALFKPAGTALLAREMYARGHRPLTLRIGEPMAIAADTDPTAALRAVRKALYALGKRRAAPGPEPLAPPVPVEALRRSVEATELLGETADGKQIRAARLQAGSPLLHELGRLRELTFRQVGEGTGRSRDLDAYDAHYEQIVLWDAQAQRIAGGYRVMRGARALAERGLAGLYTASLFRYADEALPRLAEGMELGRSFVVPDYWGSRSLDYLWQGIGAYLRRHPHVRYLFGPVSISAALPLAAREQLVAYYQRYYGSPHALAASNQPFEYFAAPPSFGEMDADTAFNVLKGNLAALGTAVPTLYKQYTELCEPGGARFLAFGVDPQFSDSIDGLIEVDMHLLRPKKRKRYLLTDEVAA
ncbi:lysophospholipid acyltransferase family protein [Luteimonas sp. SX5]|uniref:L-ornithine N(alpha)-acyltransferase n=1 Tax=Luteimonas galliterrae TaxID=2940486 RepID=A0ABT0MMA9_9GAMM|nr:lysophospholipid acyltransferase family protein [Luteimonas galliterrae]MCL1635359.1 lysophospholipid acyltransferase family protein [Luteimonas galliterrae]